MNNTRITELESLINKYATSYYSGVSEVSDDYFDSLVDELRQLDPNSEFLKTGWGYTPHKKVPHKYNLHIGSLSKVKSINEMDSRWDSTTTRVSAKLDGLSVVTYYEEGKRVQAITRGNGNEGIDVTHHMELIAPQDELLTNPDHSLFTGAIRGEVVMPMETWYNNYEYMRKENPSLNPRNIASGLMNRKEITENEASDLKYVVYKVLYCENYNYDNWKDIELLLADRYINGFSYFVPSTFYYAFNEESFKSLYDYYCEMYPCDGLVFTNLVGNSYDEIAFKFQAESKTVTVTGIEWSATRTGRIVPTVTFDSVELSGAMVSRASGFNATFIKDNKIGKGAEIEVCRSGEVIPHIMKVITPCVEGELPEVCPHCGNKLVWKNTDLICNAENESQMPYNALTVLAPLDGAGDAIYSTIVKAMNLYSVSAFEDFIYNNNYGFPGEMLQYIKENSDLSGEVTTAKVDTILSKLRGPVDLRDVLVACSIPGISEKMAEKIAFAYPDILVDAQLDCINKDKLYEINGIGDSIVNSLDTFKDRLGMMVAIFNVVVPEKKTEPEVQFKVAITGKLSVKRSVFEEELKQYGYQPSDIKKDTKYLITDNPNSSSSKNKLADEWGIIKITEKDFRNQFMNN